MRFIDKTSLIESSQPCKLFSPRIQCTYVLGVDAPLDSTEEKSYRAGLKSRRNIPTCTPLLLIQPARVISIFQETRGTNSITSRLSHSHFMHFTEAQTWLLKNTLASSHYKKIILHLIHAYQSKRNGAWTYPFFTSTTDVIINFEKSYFKSQWTLISMVARDAISSCYVNNNENCGFFAIESPENVFG